MTATLLLPTMILLTAAAPRPEPSAADLQPSTIRRATYDNVNAQWRFSKGDVEGAESPRFDDSKWETISLPHTWNARDGQDGGNDYCRGTGWYRKHIRLKSNVARKRLFIRFGAANTVTDVYWNGRHVGQHRGGFAAFCFEVTDAMQAGRDNMVAVRVSNAPVDDVPPLSADFTFFGGIYRPIELLATTVACITPLDYASPGVYVRPTRINEDAAVVDVIIRVSNGHAAPRPLSLVTTIRNARGRLVAADTRPTRVSADPDHEFVHTLRIDQPILWDGRNNPHCYRVTVTLVDGNRGVDAVSVPLGLRTFNVDPDTGFTLNGRPYHLHGVNRHQDRLDMGWAIGPEQHREDFDLICEMGCTAVRLAHYQHADCVYDLCDRRGLVAWAEIPLVNRITDSPAFAANCRQQLVELIRQNYNHPSIFFWCVHNEITAPWDPGPDPTALVGELAALAKEEDPSRRSVCAGADPLDHPANHQTELVGLNRYFGWYGGEPDGFGPWVDEYHAAYPDEPLAISEYGAGASIRHHEWPATKPKHNGPWHPEEWQAIVHERHWLAMKQRPYLWATFVWNMFDFGVDARNEGDTKGRNDKGLVTYDRQTKKDAFYWYKANWSDDPVVHITSRRFRDREDPTTNIKIYSNGDRVELFVNGQSLGAVTPKDCLAQWSDVTLAAGKNQILAVANKGKRTCRDRCVWTYKPWNHK